MPVKNVVILDGTHNWEDDFALERAAWEPLNISLTVAEAETESEIVSVAWEADVIVYMGLYTPFTDAVMAQLPRCRMIIRYGIGVDSVDAEAATHHGIVVANTAEYCVEDVADHAAALLLDMARRTHLLDGFVRGGGWQGKLAVVGPVPRLSTQTVGIVGLGRIGSRMARRMAPFAGRILAADPYIEPAAAGAVGAILVGLDELLAQADFVTLHTPLTAETRHLIGPAQLRRMKPTAFLINTSRGPVVDEAALVDALQSQQIAGAALDVVEVEPLPIHSPLRSLDNVVLTPHFAYYSEQSIEDMRRMVARSVFDVLEGYWPPFVVNPDVHPRFSLNHRPDL